MTLLVASAELPEARSLDPLLRAYFDRPDESSAEDVLGDLIRDEASPVIRRIVRSRFRASPARGAARETDDLDDVANEVLLQVVRRLRRAREAGGAEPIASFRSYVATAAYRACDAYLREKYPERFRLRNRVQYLVSHHAGFFIRKDDDGWLCGLQRDTAREDATRHLATTEPREVLSGAGDPLETKRLAATLTAVFQAIGGPCRIEPLVSWLMALSEQRGSEEADGETESYADRAPDVQLTMEQQSYLRRLWDEVRQLPRMQRVALLFNLRSNSGDEVVSLFPLIGIATIPEIAAAVEIETEEFARIWNELPWDDLRIGSWAGLTRQQVINLRKSARERLGRRLGVSREPARRSSP